MSDLYCPFCLSALPDQQTPCCGEVGHGATQEEVERVPPVLSGPETPLRGHNEGTAP